MVISHTIYLDVKSSCNSLLKTLWRWQLVCWNICRGLKYILYMSIILCICWLVLDLCQNARYIQYKIRLHCLIKKIVILVHCFNKRFLIKLSQLYFKHAYDLFSSWRVGDWPCRKSDTIPAGRERNWIWPFSSRRVGHKPWRKSDMPVGCNPAELHPEQDWDLSARVHLPYTLFSHFNMAFHILLLYSTVI